MNKKILIFRRGSIGDAVISLPALNAIRQKYPKAELRLLTNTPVMENAAQMETLLGRSSLITDYFALPPGGGGFSMLKKTITSIKAWHPDKLFYLSEPSQFKSLIKEYLFFRACGINDIVGMPFRRSLRFYIQKRENLWESEGERLLRAIGLTKPVKLETLFEEDEEKVANKIVLNAFGSKKFIALCIGGKLADKDWGDTNWRAVLDTISLQFPELGILLIGSEEENFRANSLTNSWQGLVLNLCGKTNPRTSALAMKDALFYLGHDSGPMHLAALVGLPCVALFSARAKPGAWFPDGKNHHIFYPWQMADNISSKVRFRNAGTSISSINPDDVIKTCVQLLNEQC